MSDAQTNAQASAERSGSELVGGEELFSSQEEAVEDSSDLGWEDLHAKHAQAAEEEGEEEASGEPDADTPEAIAARVEAAITEEENRRAPEKRKWKPSNGHERFMESDRKRAQEEARQYREKLDRIERMLAEKFGEKAPDQSEEELTIGEKLLKKQEDLERRLRESEEARVMEQAKQQARATIDDTAQVLIQEQNSSRVFKAAMKHLENVVKWNVENNEEVGATPQERYNNAAMAQMRRFIEWRKKGVDPVEGMYRLAMSKGFDPDEWASANGITFDDNGNEVVQQYQAQQPEAPAPAPRKRPTTPAEKIAAAKRREATGSVGAMSGRPASGYNARTSAGKDAKQRDWEVKKAMADGQLRPAKRSRYPSMEDLLEGIAYEQ